MASTHPRSTSPVHTLQQAVLKVVNEPFQRLTGRPLIGNGVNGANCAPGTGAPGGEGGWLFGNGGNGGHGATNTAAGVKGGAGVAAADSGSVPMGTGAPADWPPAPAESAGPAALAESAGPAALAVAAC